MARSDDQEKAFESILELQKALAEIGSLGDIESLPPEHQATIASLLGQVEELKAQAEAILFPPGSPILACKRQVASLARTMIEADSEPAEIRLTIRAIRDRVLPDLTEGERASLTTHTEAALDEVLGPEAEGA